jgi:glycosyltransferase involved in cell wall biosynthesis
VLVPPADSRALADAIVHLLHDTRLATHLGTAARAHIVDHFSVRRMVRSTEDLYVELLERKQRKRLPSAAC